MITSNDLLTLLPLIFLAAWAVLLLLVDLWIPIQKKGITASLAAMGLIITIGLVFWKMGPVTEAFNKTVRVDGISSFLSVLFLVSGLGAISLAYDYLRRMGWERSEYYSLVLISVCGMMLMSAANDFMTVFLALEMLSIPLYILAAFVRHDPSSEEAGLKYFLLGAFSTGFFLYGAALVYGGTGYTSFPSVLGAIQNGSANLSLVICGAVLMLTGFAFKTALVPFHAWSPDVYQGAPSPVTAFLSVGAKAAGFTALLRVFLLVLPLAAEKILPVLWLLSVLTMLVGNIAALNQQNIKRLLAYSGIAQSGYMMMAFVSYGKQSLHNEILASLLFYLAVYMLGSYAAWSVVIALEKSEGKNLELNDYSGLARKYPALAFVMLVAMLSFTGIPLTAGFWGKFYLFSAAVQGGQWALACIGLLASVLSGFYYLRLVVYMYMKPGAPSQRRDRLVQLTAGIATFGLLLLGIAPWILAQKAIELAALF